MSTESDHITKGDFLKGSCQKPEDKINRMGGEQLKNASQCEFRKGGYCLTHKCQGEKLMKSLKSWKKKKQAVAESEETGLKTEA